MVHSLKQIRTMKSVLRSTILTIFIQTYKYVYNIGRTFYAKAGNIPTSSILKIFKSVFYCKIDTFLCHDSQV